MQPDGRGLKERRQSPWGEGQIGLKQAFEFQQRFLIVDDVIELGESCEPANVGNGCSATCVVESGWTCPVPGQACIKLPVCGNGVRELGEQCDDGHTAANGDGCSTTCQIETGYVCQTAGQFCIKEVCGNGTRTQSEACDDGNVGDGDGCSSGCTIETGWACNNAMPPSACHLTVCGDGQREGEETCDDGNVDPGDGCDEFCAAELIYGEDCVHPAQLSFVNNVATVTGDTRPHVNNNLTGEGNICSSSGVETLSAMICGLAPG